MSSKQIWAVMVLHYPNKDLAVVALEESRARQFAKELNDLFVIDSNQSLAVVEAVTLLE
jgi:hypothetical protein